MSNFKSAKKFSKLPNGYTELEFLQSDGNAYIKTDLIDNSTTKIDFDFEILQYDENKVEIGTYDGSVANYHLYARNNPNRVVIRIQGGSLTTDDTVIYNGTLTGKHSLVIDYNTFTYKLDNETPQTFVHGNRYATTKISLFGRGKSGGTTDILKKMKLYRYKYEQDGEIVLNLIPAKRNSDSVLGMYDLVNNVFYTNNGTGTFIAGSELPSGTKTFKSVKAFSRLPSGYTELEYIESDGTEYINTGVIPTINTDFAVKTQRISTSNLPRFGVRWSPSPAYDTFGMSMSNNSNVVAYYGRYSSSQYKQSASTYPTEVVETSLIGNTVKINNETFTITRPSSLQGTPTEMYINCITPSTLGMGRYYYCKIWDNNTLVRDFIPAKNSQGVVGMYDLVNGVFYTNDGTGSFTAGPTIKEVEYIQSSGTQYIDTGVKGNQNTRIDIEYEYLSGSPSSRVFGNRVNNRNKELFLGTLVGSVPDKLFLGYRNGGLSSATGYDNISINIELNTRVRITINDDYSLTVNGAKYNLTSLSSNTFTTSANLDLFRGSIDGGSTYKGASVKIYMFKLWDGNTLIRDLVPIQVGTEYAMYDKVSHQVFRNSGTGSFTGGEEVSGGLKHFIIAKQISLIPSEYEQVGYIESDGSQYITLPIKYNSSNKYIIDTKFNIKAQSNTTYSGWDAGGSFGINTNGQYSDGNNTSAKVSIDNKDVILNFIINSGTNTQTVSNLIVDETNYSYSRSHTSLTSYASTSDYPVLSWYSQSSYSTTRGLVGKMYYFQVKVNDTLVHNFIPVRKKSNNEYGMYDTVTKQFYGNSGTGSFTGGN